jgi:outer membrane cobalamin receptor
MYHIRLVSLFSLFIPLLCCGATLQPDSVVTEKKKVKQDAIYKEKELSDVSVVGKDRTQRLREGAFSVNAVNIGDKVNSINDITDIINRTAGVKVRTQGGMGSDFDLSVNGLSGNSIRYFIDGVPLETKGAGMKFSDIPINLIQRIEIYKGVVPSSFGIDALGGAVNIVTKASSPNTSTPPPYLDASYSIGAFGTHQLNINGQYVLPKTKLILRPVIAYNHSKNNYTMKEVEVWDEESRKYLPTERKRFHDGYTSFLAQFEAGFTNMPWADAAFITASFSQMHKELQTGATQSRVYGMAERESKAWNIAARYVKRNFILPKLDVKFSASHTWDNSITTDTCFRKYDWNGNYIKSSRSEITSRERSRRHYGRPLTNVLLNLGYTFNDNHQLDFNYSLNRIGNKQWDDVSEIFIPSNDVLAKHILALTYNQLLLNDRMKNTFFVKDYVNHLSVEQTYIPSVTNSRDVMGSNINSYLGAGGAMSFEIWRALGIKMSYERSVRLPLSRELLGNASTIYPNLTLRPEESNNWNAGIYGTISLSNSHSLEYDVNGFIRDVDNYIQPTISEKEGMIQYGNLDAIYVKGLETELRYIWRNRMHATGNISWQNARDRMQLKSDGKPSATYNNRVPNRPWLYANLNLDYEFHNILSRNDRLTLSAAYQWVHWYFLTWEAYGYAETKARIPRQNIFDATATYSFHNGRYNITLGCNNLFDHLAYDNYKLQKPGRYVYAKFRLFLQ